MHSEHGNEASFGEIQECLWALHRKGIKLWSEDGHLRYRAPKGALTVQELQALRNPRQKVASLVSCGYFSSRERRSQIDASRGCAPLSFTQLAHWNLRQEVGGRPIRQVAWAGDLGGRLNIEQLKESLSEVIRRHEALRTRIVCADGIPMQEVTPGSHDELEVIKLRCNRGDGEVEEVGRQVQKAILDADDYAVSPLFRAVLLSTHDGGGVLVLALDHIISDGVSLNILCQELFAGYAQLRRSGRIDLPPVSAQFSEYATMQWAQPMASFNRLQSRLSSIGRAEFPMDSTCDRDQEGAGWGVIKFSIEPELRQQLHAWAVRHGTTLVMVVFTAYAILAMRWCNTSEMVIQFLTAGRMNSEFERTVGYFAFPLYIPVTLAGPDTFNEVLARVVSEYCRACDQADFGYAQAQVPRPDFARNTIFNWLPEYSSDLIDAGNETGDEIKCRRLEFVNPLLKAFRFDLDPVLTFFERDDEIAAEFNYSRARSSHLTMMKFVRSLKETLMAVR